jgi:hypothetical protein
MTAQEIITTTHNGYDRLYWSTLFNVNWQHTAESFINAGRILLAAKEGENRLPHGEFLKMVEEDLACSPRTAQRLMAIARHPVLSNTTHGSHLPPSWRTLSELERLPAKTLLAKIEDGTVNPKMQRKDAFGLISGDAAVKHAARMTPILKLKEENEELQRENADLHERLASAETDTEERDPLLFLLKGDDMEICVDTVIAAVGEVRTKDIALAILQRFKRRRGRPAKQANADRA